MHITSGGVGWDRAGVARVLSIAGRVIVVCAMIATAVAFALPEAAGPVAAVLYVAGFMSMVLGFSASLDAPLEKPGEVRVDEHGNLQVTMFKKRPRDVPREHIRGAWLVSRPVGERQFLWVEITLRSQVTVSVRVENEQQGRALVDALGFGTQGRAVAIPLAKRTRRLTHLLLGLVAYVVVTFGGLLIGGGGVSFVVFPFLYELLRFLFRPPVLEIGSDALQVGVGVRRLRILKQEIARIVFFAPASLIIEKKDGTKHRILPLALDPARVAAAAELVDRRLGDRPALARANVFERGGRSLEEWRAGLRTALDPSYRSSGATIDDASAVLSSETSTVEQRVGAALALRIAGEPLERVRVAAEGAVDPRVRVVLDAIAEGADDERLDAKLRVMGARR